MTAEGGITFAILLLISFSNGQQQQSNNARKTETFKAELFLNNGDLNSGLYEGMVVGRRRFGGTQTPHGFGVINYFTNDPFQRLNYTGEWVSGNREGNGTTYFKDGTVYEGEYRDGVEHGDGKISYPNGNVLEGEFEHGKIHGHAVFRYKNGDQREGFFRENILDGQVIFTEKSSGRTVIELWRNGERRDDEEQVVKAGSAKTSTERSTSRGRDNSRESHKTGESENSLNQLTHSRSSSRGRGSTTRPSSSQSSDSNSRSSVDENLDKLREAIKTGDKSRKFFFGPSAPELASGGGRNGKDEEETAEEQMDRFRRLRAETERADRSILLQVFRMVNGGTGSSSRGRR